MIQFGIYTAFLGAAIVGFGLVLLYAKDALDDCLNREPFL